jgi:hypothetical protein
LPIVPAWQYVWCHTPLPTRSPGPVLTASGGDHASIWRHIAKSVLKGVSEVVGVKFEGDENTDIVRDRLKPDFWIAVLVKP